MNETLRIGPFIFEYDPAQHLMYLHKDEEHIATAEHIWANEWAEFAHAVKVAVTTLNQLLEKEPT